MTTWKSSVTSALMFFLLSCFGYAQTATCTGWKTFKVSNEFNTSANGINAWDTVVGGTTGAFGATNPAPAFIRYSNGNISKYVYQNHATAFWWRNSQGVTVGSYTDSSSHQHGIVVYSSNVATLSYPGASDTVPLGINKWGSIVGYYLLFGSTNTHGFQYKGGKFYSIKFPKSVQTVVHSINDNGVMVGDEWTGTGVYESFIYKNGTFTTLKAPKATGATFAYDINNNGTIVGDYIVGVNPQSFLYINGSFKDIIVPSSTLANTNGINGSDYVTGEAFGSDGSSSGFIAHCQ